jgi:D-alanyl-lipoteichoic acid acyltransferase DltB (MBOAT superfamily)
MSFLQVEFLAFLLVVLALQRLARTHKQQNAVLLLASGIFYGWVHPWYVLLLAFSTLLDFGVVQGMQRRPDRRGALLAVSIAGNLGLLAVFKYLDFFIESWQVALAALGLDPGLEVLGIALPVGISFFTFQTMSYTIDVYRGQLEPRRSLLDYATFVCLFPQLIAGPIERARDLLPQVERRREIRAGDVASGAGLALWGAVQKVVIADNIGLYVDRVWTMEDATGPMVWAGALAFTVEILADFGGYSDMARGIGRMLGLRLSVNFRAPYLAASPIEFWQRWHMTLSTWLRDYVYLPLVFSPLARRLMPLPAAVATFGRMAVAVSLTMLLSGLWHGARWTCVLWGAYWAALMVGWMGLERLVPGRLRRGRAWRAGATAVTFLATVFSMLVFREPDVASLVVHLRLPPLGGDWQHWIAATVVFELALLGGALLAVGGAVLRRAEAGHPLLQRPEVRAVLWALGIVAVGLFTRDLGREFIYFRF